MIQGLDFGVVGEAEGEFVVPIGVEGEAVVGVGGVELGEPGGEPLVPGGFGVLGGGGLLEGEFEVHGRVNGELRMAN